MKKLIMKIMTACALCSSLSIAHANQDPNMVRFEIYMSCAKQIMQVRPVDRASEIRSVRSFASCIDQSGDPILQQISTCIQSLANRLEPYIDDPNSISQQQIAGEMQRCMQRIKQ